MAGLTLMEYDITIRIASNTKTEAEVLKLFEDYWEKSAVSHPLFNATDGDGSCAVSIKVEAVRAIR